MKTCPRCRYALGTLSNGLVDVDHCSVCRGNFFEPHAMAKTFGVESSPERWVTAHCATKKGRTKLRCPVDAALLEAYDVGWGDEPAVEVDVCPTCRGLWLDEREGGQLAAAVGAHDDERALADKVTLKGYLFQLLTGVPVEVWNPRRKRAVAVLTLVVTLIVIHLGMAVPLSQDAAFGEALFRSLSVVPERLVALQQPWSLVTYAFLHLGLAHLLGNLYMLWIFGDNVEERLGLRRFLALYLSAAVVGGVFHVVSDPSSDVLMAGASGAISGVMGAYLVMFPRVKLRLIWLFVPFRISVAWYFVGWITLQVVMAGLEMPGVAWFAHLGGFLAGLVIGAWDRRWLTRRLETAAD